VQSRDPWEALKALVQWWICGKDCFLLDADASAAERQAVNEAVNELLPAAESPNVCIPDKPMSAEQWQQLFRNGRGGRLGLFTSGTSGVPKLVIHQRDSLIRGIRWRNPQINDVCWGNTYHPLHMAGIQVALQALANVQPQVSLYALDRERLESALHRLAISHLTGTPSFFRLLLPLPAPASGVRSVSVGGESLDGDLLKKLQHAFPNAKLRNIYASTEAGSLFAAEGEWFRIPERLREKVRVVDGELWLHADLLGKGVASGDWFATGDAAAYDPEDNGRFQITGRSSNRISVGGFRVDPELVEAALLAIPGIRMARVFGRPNALLGNILCAECAGEPVPERELRQQLRQRLAEYQVPRQLAWVESLATTRSGKLKRINEESE
jgi:acyl-coenzyme A synthetase/AMP-(fatty) acid ligase